ncbi:MAG: hypothetical protein HOP28_01060 [Gemmatimonadales bacterium]|nr:hypothetical protein [Gemmatimonadales bacterium]
MTRREMVAAVGAGIAAAACRKPAPAPEQSRAPASAGKVTVVFHGVYLVTRVDSDHYEVYLPTATTKPASGKHDRCSDAHIHTAHLAVFDKPGGALQASFELTQRNLTLIGAFQGAGYLPSLDKLIAVSTFLPPATRRRKYTGVGSSRYASRIRLFGGTLSADASDNVGEWEIDSPLQQGSPTGLRPATMLVWNAMTANVPVLAAGTISTPPIPSELIAATHPTVVIGHSPLPPDKWYDPPQNPIKQDDIDHDFKWLYSILIPNANEANNNPWPSEIGSGCLPAPRCTTAPPPLSSQGTLRPMTVGSSTCFGATDCTTGNC